jgi:hypothetical protein
VEVPAITLHPAALQIQHAPSPPPPSPPPVLPLPLPLSPFLPPLLPPPLLPPPLLPPPLLPPPLRSPPQTPLPLTPPSPPSSPPLQTPPLPPILPLLGIASALGSSEDDTDAGASSGSAVVIVALSLGIGFLAATFVVYFVLRRRQQLRPKPTCKPRKYPAAELGGAFGAAVTVSPDPASSTNSASPHKGHQNLPIPATKTGGCSGPIHITQADVVGKELGPIPAGVETDQTRIDLEPSPRGAAVEWCARREYAEMPRPQSAGPQAISPPRPRGAAVLAEQLCAARFHGPPLVAVTSAPRSALSVPVQCGAPRHLPAPRAAPSAREGGVDQAQKATLATLARCSQDRA